MIQYLINFLGNHTFTKPSSFDLKNIGIIKLMKLSQYLLFLIIKFLIFLIFLDKLYGNQIYLQLFTKIITQSLNDTIFYSEHIDSFNANVNIEFYNEDDLYN